MPDEIDVRLWALAGGPWSALKTLVAEAAAATGQPPHAIAPRMMEAILIGDIAIRVSFGKEQHFEHIYSRRAAELYAKAGTFDLINWLTGCLRVSSHPIEVYWPDVVKLLSTSEPSRQKAAKPSKIRQPGRPLKYDWPSREKLALEWLDHNGFGEQGDQARFEEYLLSMFPDAGKSTVRVQAKQFIEKFEHQRSTGQ